VLASGKTPGFDKRLVYDEQTATDVSAYVDPREISGQFGIVVTARPGRDLDQIEKAVDEEISRLLAKGPSEEELRRARQDTLPPLCEHRAHRGFGGKSDILAMNQTFRGAPEFIRRP